jgi:hypothetical protein
MAKPKEVTREQAARKKSQAAAFMERIAQPDRAEEFDSMSVDDYAEHKGFRLTNPHRRRIPMPQPSGPTKTDLQDSIDGAIEILDDAYQPESTREELATAVGSALDVLRGDTNGDEDDDNGDVDDDENDQDDDDGDNCEGGDDED